MPTLTYTAICQVLKPEIKALNDEDLIATLKEAVQTRASKHIINALVAEMGERGLKLAK